METNTINLDDILQTPLRALEWVAKRFNAITDESKFQRIFPDYIAMLGFDDEGSKYWVVFVVAKELYQGSEATGKLEIDTAMPSKEALKTFIQKYLL